MRKDCCEAAIIRWGHRRHSTGKRIILYLWHGKEMKTESCFKRILNVNSISPFFCGYSINVNMKIISGFRDQFAF